MWGAKQPVVSVLGTNLFEKIEKTKNKNKTVCFHFQILSGLEVTSPPPQTPSSTLDLAI